MESKDTKNCPYCGEEILAVAKKCKHCGEWLDKTSKPNTPVPIQHNNSSQNSQNLQKEEAKQPPVAVQVNSYERRRKSYWAHILVMCVASVPVFIIIIGQTLGCLMFFPYICRCNHK